MPLDSLIDKSLGIPDSTQLEYALITAWFDMWTNVWRWLKWGLRGYIVALFMTWPLFWITHLEVFVRVHFVLFVGVLGSLAAAVLFVLALATVAGLAWFEDFITHRSEPQLG